MRSASRSSACIISKAICCRRCSPIRSRRFRSSRCWSPAGTASCSRSRASGAIGCSATRRTTPPARRSTRRRSCSACPIPGGPALARLAETGRDGAVALPRPMLDSGDLDMSFCGLKTAVLTLVRREAAGGTLDDARRADIAREFQHAVVDVLVAKALAALGGHADDARLVVAGGVGANRELRARLVAAVAERGGAGVLPRSRVLHRQRRDDRAGRRAAPGSRARRPIPRFRSGRAGISRTLAAT